MASQTCTPTMWPLELQRRRSWHMCRAAVVACPVPVVATFQSKWSPEGTWGKEQQRIVMRMYTHGSDKAFPRVLYFAAAF